MNANRQEGCAEEHVTGQQSFTVMVDCVANGCLDRNGPA